jgi:hypothetical protein
MGSQPNKVRRGRIDRKLVQEMRDWEAKLNRTANSNLREKEN